ncbi:hypothetical protein BDC45DRAFT_453250, partial [Circinella umbellata]
YIQRVAPSYPLPIFTFSIIDLNTFYNWFNNIASQHANFVKNGSYTPVKISNSTFNNAITHVVDCKAKIECRILLDNTCEIIYYWQHSSHNSTEYSELKKSCFPVEVKNWINEHVEKNMDWKAFKDLLCLSPKELQEVSEL